MKSEGRQIDFVDQQAMIRAHYVAAEYALRSPYHTEQERQERAAYYREQAERLAGAL